MRGAEAADVKAIRCVANRDSLAFDDAPRRRERLRDLIAQAPDKAKTLAVDESKGRQIIHGRHRVAHGE
jgi:hypothetical protein